jgi:hypothetical protein
MKLNDWLKETKKHTFTVDNIWSSIVGRRGESFIIFPTHSHKKRFALGVATLIKISKGHDFDVLEMNFGLGWVNPRKIIVKDMDCRKQVSLLKVNQFVLFYGMICVEKMDDEKRKNFFYAKALMPFYVPNAVDIRHLEELTDFNKLEEDDEDYENGKDFLTQFEK